MALTSCALPARLGPMSATHHKLGAASALKLSALRIPFYLRRSTPRAPLPLQGYRDERPSTSDQPLPLPPVTPPSPPSPDQRPPSGLPTTATGGYIGISQPATTNGATNEAPTASFNPSPASDTPAPVIPSSDADPTPTSTSTSTSISISTTHPASPAASASANPPALASMDMVATYPDSFVRRRLLVFVGITLGYMGLYFTRGSLTYTAPVMVGTPELGVTLRDIGAMTSAFPLAYGISKFLGGVLGTRFSARAMLGGGLAVTAAINLAFGALGVAGAAGGAGASVAGLTALWALNGGLQGIGAPASAALLTRWFASKERGTYWGLWNTGANMGGFLTPVLVGYVAKQYGWQWGMWAPGLIGLTVAAFTLAAVRDSPEAAGYAPTEVVPSSSTSSSSAPSSPGSSSSSSTSEKPSIRQALSQVLKHPGTWLLAFTYFFVYIVRQGATSWLVFYLLNAKGAVDAASAAITVSGLELGGLVGGTLAGFLSDMRIRTASAKNNSQAVQSGRSSAASKASSSNGQGSPVGFVGQRVQIVMAYVAATLGVLATLRVIPPEAKWAQWGTIAALGFCIYGPHMLIGLCGAELVDKQSVGASQGVLGLVAYMGAANAGVPLSWVVHKFGWDGYFAAMAAACCVALALLAPLANAQSFVQQRTAGATA